MSQDLKTCSKCNETKVRSLFPKSAWGRRCRACIYAYNRAYKNATPERREKYRQGKAESYSRCNSGKGHSKQLVDRAQPCVVPGCVRMRDRSSGMCGAHEERRVDGRDLAKPIAGSTIVNDAGDKLFVCCDCGDYKPPTDFHKNAGKRKGAGIASRCKPCEASRKKLSRLSASVCHGDATTMVASARARARELGREFSLTNHIAIPIRCPVLGIELRHGVGSPTDNSPTLDRIDNDLGYVDGNVAVISRRANRIKSDASLEELEAIVQWLRANLPRRRAA